MLVSSIPALPVRSVEAAADFYLRRLGFVTRHRDDGFAIVVRDDVELHLWLAGDTGWRLRPAADLGDSPVRTGAEDFVAGTASCRVRVDGVRALDELYDELSATAVLHPSDGGAPADTAWETREFAALDLDGNLLTFVAGR